MATIIGDQVTDDIAQVTFKDGTVLEVVLPPYPNFPDSAPKLLSITGQPGRVFERTSTFGFGPQGPNTYSEIEPAVAHVRGA